MGRTLLVSAIVLSLVGCSSPTPAPTFSPTPTPTPTPTAPPAEPISGSGLPEGVIATGAFVSVGFETAGTVRLSHDNDVVSFDLVDFSTTAEGYVSLMFSREVEPASRTCFDTGYRYDLGPIDALPGEIPTSLFLSDGMTDFRSAVIVLGPADGSAECLGDVVAVAELAWDIPQP